jgi:lipopolysaccharide/colanic/teichoic acid biosynthesis glycosyltransferase
MRFVSMMTAAPRRRPWYEKRGRRPVPAEAHELRYKRVMDVAVALALLPVVLPILAVCAMAIRLDSPGPIFFRQERTGQGGRRFRMYKLRTMVENAHELKEQYQYLNTLKAPDFKIVDDPRITRVGKFLRKTSLDEIPQILNVLLGDMSLVGPRPTSFSSSTYSAWHTARLEAKSGLTGLWQVSGRSDLEFDERVRLDIAYQRCQCFWLDVQILARTVGAVLTRRGAS